MQHWLNLLEIGREKLSGISCKNQNQNKLNMKSEICISTAIIFNSIINNLLRETSCHVQLFDYFKQNVECNCIIKSIAKCMLFENIKRYIENQSSDSKHDSSLYRIPKAINFILGNKL